MASYNSEEIAILRSDHYFDFFERRGIKFAKIRRTKTFEAIHGLELEIKEEHVWSHGDTLLRLSRKYYGSGKLWTSIALMNRKPTDAHYSIGDIVYIVKDPNAVTGKL
jgi:nucleoid-associated protein YgaU